MTRSRSLRHCAAMSTLVLLIVNCQVIFAGNVTTVGTDNSWPTNAEIVLADPLTEGLFGDDTNGDDDGSLAQSFQVLGSPLDLRSIYMRYRNDSGSTGDMTSNLTIFTIDNVQASSHAEPPPGTGSVVLSETVIFPEALESSTNRVAHILLDSPVTLPANSGNEGYVLHFTGNADLNWFRTGSTANNVYNFGHFFEDGAWKNSGERDATLALSSRVPEPSSLIIASIMSLTLLIRLRTS